MIHTIGTEFYMIRSTEEDFHRNIYLKRFIGSDGKAVNMLFDPGTRLDMGNMLPMLKEKAGGIANTNLVFLSHQDPDLTANIGTVLASAPRSYLITSVDTWRLVKMYGLPEKRVRTVESFDSMVLKMKKSGHRVRFVPARYCHFRGAMMVYDYESRVLFSGDVFGGVNTREGDGIYATEDSWEGIKLFHQLYMPSSKALQKTMEAISMLNPFPETIAPQHGDVIKGDFVIEFMDRLSRLQVGADLMEENNPEVDLAVLGINNFLELMGINFPEVRDEFLSHFQKGNDFTSPFVFTGGTVSGIKISPDNALMQIYAMIGKIEDRETQQHLRAIFMDSMDQLDIHFKAREETAPSGDTIRNNDFMNLEDLLE
jgi:glyoxylase-like metal-dependent hydrolase (beta-lactamase superfamily II)